MKKFLYSTLIAVAGLLVFACKQEHIELVYDPAKAVAETLGEINGVTLDAQGVAITTTFNPADFKMKVAQLYTLYASASSDMSDKAKVSSSISVDDKGIGHISINQPVLNSLIFALGGVADEPFTVYFQLEGSMSNDKNGGIDGTYLYSNIVSASFTAYSTIIKDKDLYEHVWVIGASSYVGSWSFEKVYQFLYDYEKTGNVFTGLIDFGEDGPSGGFKLVGVDNWNDETKNWGSEAQAEDPEVGTIQLIAGGGSKDIKCYSKRYYFFSYDTATLILTTKYGFDNVGIVGAFNGWNAADPDMKMEYNSHLHRFYIDHEFAENTELKFTCDDNWDLNWGGADGKTAGGGANIAVEAGSYRIYLDINKGTYEFSTSMYGKDEPTGEDEPEPVVWEGWGVVGTINDWGGSEDIHMTTVGEFWVAKNVELTTADQFKFRKDEDWGINIGAAGEVEPFVVELGAKYEGVAGGKNLGVPADGTYDLYVNPEALTFYVMAPGEVPGEIATWGVVGNITDWGGQPDFAMSEENGMLVRKNLELPADAQFKVRFQSSWDVNRGGPGSVEPFVMIGDAMKAVPGGKNLGVPEAGTYDIWYDELNEVIFVVPAGEALTYWGVVGNITGWGGDRADYIMYKDGDFYLHENVSLPEDAQYKIRYCSDWGVNRGAPGDVEPFKVDANTVVDATANGKNLGVNVAGEYDIYYNPTEEKLYVMAPGEKPDGAEEPVIPEPTAPDSWGVVGDFTGWADGADAVMAKNGDWFIATGLEIKAGEGFKIRGDGAWTFNRGAEGEVEPFNVTVGEGFAVVQNGKNLTVPADGSYDVYYQSVEEVMYVMAAGEEPEGYVAYPEFIYAIGADTGWSDVYPLKGNEGKYKGFGYLSGEFKFKPNADNWDGDWECVGEGQIGQGSNNCPAPATAGYYMIEVDLTAMTYQLTIITTIGIIGPAQAGGWDIDTDLTYNAETRAWEAKGVTLATGEMKFRANDDWAINWGGELLEALTQGGNNIPVTAGTYDVALYAWCDGFAYATLTAAE